MYARRDKGFTLVEVLVVASILVVVMGIVYGSLSASLRSKEICEEGVEAYRRGRLILERMSREISSAYIPIGINLPDVKYIFRGEDGEEDGFPRDTLNFTSTALPIEGLPHGVKEVGFYIAPDPETGKPVLFLREDTTCDDDPEGGGKRYLLGRGVSGLDFTYYDSQGREWRVWDSTYTPLGVELPRMVKISLFLEDKRGEVILLSTKVRIPQG